MYERILKGKLILNETQSGFRTGRIVHNNIFIVKQIIQKTLLSKTNLFFIFMDLKKPFDTVKSEKYWKAEQN